MKIDQNGQLESDGQNGCDKKWVIECIKDFEMFLTHLDREAPVDGREGEFEALVQSGPEERGERHHSKRLAHVAGVHRDDWLRENCWG